MAFADASRLEQGAVIDADVCVVGAGPAGLAVALELAAAGLSVLILESGGPSVEPATAELDELESAGGPPGEDPRRDRRFGGTAWYGRCVVLDAIDFEARPWVPASGWPLSPPEVESCYPRAARFLGLRRPAALGAGFWQDEPVARAISGGGLAARVHLVTGAKHLGRRHHAAVAGSPRLTALLHATVVGIEVDEAARTVTHLCVRGPGGQKFKGRARRYVVACGALENARLLLLLAADQPGVLGPSGEALGRYYMNHARCDGIARLHLDPAHPEYGALFRRLTEGYCYRSRCRVQLAVGLDDQTQRREELLNASAFFYAASAPRLAELRRLLDELGGSAAGRRTGRADLLRSRRLLRELPLLFRAGLARLCRKPFLLDSLVMVEQLEQSPDHGSRVVLGDARDRFGRRRLRLQSRIGPDTIRTQRRLHRLLAERVRQQRLGKLDSALLADPDFEPPYGDARHPMGSTRMAADPRHGVVDGDGRVHGLENLYLAGSSVFPTGGHANPTLALVALALRLGDHLRAEMGRSG